MRRHRLRALAIGAAVLVGIAWVVWQLFLRSREGDERQAPGAGTAVEQPQLPAPPPSPTPAPPTDPRPEAGSQAIDAARQVAGIVRLPSGRPAAGATVTLYRARSAWPEWRRDQLDQAITGSEGTFAFRREREPDLLVGFEHANYAGDLVEVPLPLARLELTLQPGFDLTGTVVAESGAPVPGARVLIESTVTRMRRALSTLTAGNGRFRFTNVPGGLVRVVARHEAWQPVSQTGVVIGVERDLELHFDRQALALTGTVVVGPGQAPLAGATVLALPTGAQAGLVEPATATTNAEGAFQLGGLARGNLRLEVRHPDHASVTRTVAIGPSPTPEVFELPPRTTVSGRLLGLESLRRQGARPLELQLRSQAGELGRCTPDADGRFVFAERVTPGWATLEVADGSLAFARSGSAALQVRLLEGARNELDNEVATPVVLVGRVVDAVGQPLAGAQLWVDQADLVAERLRRVGNAPLQVDWVRLLGDQVTRTGGDDPERLLAVTDAAGAFRIAGLAPGSLVLRVAAAGHGTRRVTVTVPASGEGRQPDVVLSPGCRLTGLARRGGRPLTSVQVTVLGDGVQATALTGPQGTFAIDDLPAGDYRLRARYSTLPAIDQAVKVVAERAPPVELAFAVGRVLAGNVVGSDGQPVDGAMIMVRNAPGSHTVSDAAGNFSLEVPPTALELRVLYGDRTAPQIVAVAADAARVKVELPTPRTGTLVARVAALPGRRHLQGALVRTLPLDARGDTRPLTRWVEMQNGLLRHPWCPAGQLRVVVYCEGYAPWVGQATVGAGSEQSLGELLLEPGCSLRGRVVDGDGRPVVGCEVFLGEESDLDLFHPQLRTDRDGYFRLQGVSSAAAGVVLHAPGFAPLRRELKLPAEVLSRQPVAFVLESGSTIDVQAGSASELGSRVVILLAGGSIVASATLDENGHAVFPHRGPGDYVVQILGEEEAYADVHVAATGEVVHVQLQ